MPYEQSLAAHPSEQRYIREIIFGKQRAIRYYQITKGTCLDPSSADTWQIMTNLQGEIQQEVGRQYTLRTWIEYGFQQVKNELGWKDYRLTEYRSVERWWELIFSAYLLVSLHAEDFKSNLEGDCQVSKQAVQTYLPLSRHLYWELGNTWKSALNNLRLLMQPYCCWGWLEPWLELVPIPELRRGLFKLMDFMDTFRMSPIPLAKAA